MQNFMVPGTSKSGLGARSPGASQRISRVADHPTFKGEQGVSSKDLDEILQVFDGLHSMEESEKMLTQMEEVSRQFLADKGGKDSALLTSNDLYNLIEGYGVHLGRGRVEVMHRQLQAVEGLDGVISAKMVAVVENYLAQKLFNVFTMYAEQSAPGLRWLMKPEGFFRFLEDARFVGGGKGKIRPTMARAVAQKAYAGGASGFDYRGFMFNLGRVAHLMEAEYSEIVFDLRPLEHKLVQDTAFTRLVKHKLVQDSSAMKYSLLRSVAECEELDVADVHETERRKRFAREEGLRLAGPTSALSTSDAATAQMPQIHDSSPKLAKFIQKKKSQIGSMSVVRTLGTAVQRQHQAKDDFGAGTLTKTYIPRGRSQPGAALNNAARELNGMKGLGPEMYNTVKLANGKRVIEAQTSVYGYVRRPALRLVFGDAATSPQGNAATRGGRKSLHGSGMPVPAAPHGALWNVGAAPTSESSEEKKRMSTTGVPARISYVGDAEGHLATKGRSVPRKVSSMKFTVDTLWAEHKGSFDTMFKRSRALRLIGDVFNELSVVNKDGVEVIKASGFSRMVRACKWPCSDHIFAKFLAEVGQSPHVGMNFINFARTCEYLGLERGGEPPPDYSDTAKLLHTGLFGTRFYGADRPMSGAHVRGGAKGQAGGGRTISGRASPVP